jgi:hypothetical protein
LLQSKAGLLGRQAATSYEVGSCEAAMGGDKFIINHKVNININISLLNITKIILFPKCNLQ